jgi:3-oxoadipate enol-lactonase
VIPAADAARSADGARIAYQATGAGPPVLAVHGIGSTSRSFAPLADHLARTHRVIAVDLRGYGDSDDHPTPTGWSTLANDLAAVLAHAGCREPVHLVAASAGTPTALAFRHAHPRGVRSVTLIGPTLGDAADPAAAQKLLEQRLPALQRVHEGATERAARLAGPHADDAALELLRSQHARIRAAGYGRVARLLARTDAADLVQSVTVPMQVLVGEYDTVTGPPVADRVHQLLPRAQLVQLPEAGHSPHVEQPRRTAELIASFASSASAG